MESAGLGVAMVEYLRAAVSAVPEGSTMAAPSAAGEDEGAACRERAWRQHQSWRIECIVCVCD